MKVHWLQGRRIRCAHCEEPFVYLHEGTETFETYGVLLVSSDEGMQAGISKKARKRFAAVAAKQGLGAALCPRCRRYQPWMVRRSRLLRIGAWGGGAFAMAFCYGSFAALLAQEGERPIIPALVGMGLVGAGVAIGWKMSLPSGVVKGREDPLAIPDEEFRGLLAHCRSIDGEPLTEWYLSTHESAPKDAALLSIGCEDFTGEEFFPPKWSSETVVGAL